MRQKCCVCVCVYLCVVALPSFCLYMYHFVLFCVQLFFVGSMLSHYFTWYSYVYGAKYAKWNHAEKLFSTQKSEIAQTNIDDACSFSSEIAKDTKRCIQIWVLLILKFAQGFRRPFLVQKLCETKPLVCIYSIFSSFDLVLDNHPGSAKLTFRTKTHSQFEFCTSFDSVTWQTSFCAIST